MDNELACNVKRTLKEYAEMVVDGDEYTLLAEKNRQEGNYYGEGAMLSKHEEGLLTVEGWISAALKEFADAYDDLYFSEQEIEKATTLAIRLAIELYKAGEF